MLMLKLVVFVALAEPAAAAGYGDDLYGDSEEPKYEPPKAYEPPKYEPQHYEPPKPAYEEPKYEEPKYEENKAEPDEYEGVPYVEPTEMEYLPASETQELYLEPCENDHECGQGICDVDHKCRCMDYWWTPDPKEPTRRLGAVRGLQYAAASTLDEIEMKTQPCSEKRKSQAEAFLLQLFLGPLGMGCFYLGWNGFGAACLILGMFPIIFAIVVCFCATACICCVSPLLWCTEKICCCFFPPVPYEDLSETDQETARRSRCQACCGLIISIAFVVVWICSLFEIANHCNADGGIPCVPW